jgi:hypothetical protein
MATVQVNGMLIMHFSAAPILMQVSLQGRFSPFHIFVHMLDLTQVSAEPCGDPMIGKCDNTEDGPCSMRKSLSAAGLSMMESLGNTFEPEVSDRNWAS